MSMIRRILMVALFVAVLAGGWSFAHGNGGTISVDYLFGSTVAMPIWMVLGLAWSAGALLVALYLGVSLLRGRVENRRLRKALAGLEVELRHYRNRPIEHDVQMTTDPTNTATTAVLPAGEG